MAGVTGPVEIGQRSLHFSSTVAVADLVASPPTAPAWADVVGSGKIIVSSSSFPFEVGKVVEGPTGLGNTSSPTDVPVLGQSEADQFFPQATKSPFGFTVQARHTNDIFVAWRASSLPGAQGVFVYSERESDTAWTIATFLGRLTSFDYQGAVSNIHSQAALTVARVGQIYWIDQA